MVSKTKCFLVVDDSNASRLQMCSILNNNGYQTVQAENGLVALNKIEERNFDLVILDLLMPEMDGTMVLKKFKEKNIAIPIIIVSADIQDDVKEECFGLGAIAFLTKPYKPKDLIDVVNKNIK